MALMFYHDEVICVQLLFCLSDILSIICVLLFTDLVSFLCILIEVFRHYMFIFKLFTMYFCSDSYND